MLTLSIKNIPTLRYSCILIHSILLLECLEENDCSDQDTKKKCNTADSKCVGNGSTIIQGQHAKYDTMVYCS